VVIIGAGGKNADILFEDSFMARMMHTVDTTLLKVDLRKTINKKLKLISSSDRDIQGFISNLCL
jgi:hypothetical protein